jgi:predicted Zn-dependent peptidase
MKGIHSLAMCPIEAEPYPRNAYPGASAPVFGKTVLENGVRVITESLAGVRSVSIGVIVDCGSKDETDGEAGLAHLCEHLLFQGTSGRDALEIACQADGLGQVGAFTTRDYTCYYAATLDDYQYHALDLMGDILLNSTFPDDCVIREKQVILSELKRSHDIPEKHVHDLAYRQVWCGSSLGRPVAGNAEAIARHMREDAIYFLQRHYTPDRIVIAAAGHLDHADFVAQTRDAFWRSLGRSDASPCPCPVFQPGITIAPINSAQAYFCLIIPAPSYADQSRYVVHVLSRVLGGGISSRLSRRLRQKAALVYEVNSEYIAYRDAGMIAVEGCTSPEHLPEVASIVQTTTADLLSGREAVDAEELWRAKTHIRVQHLCSSEDVYTRMCRLATQELYLGGPVEAGEVLARIDGVELADLVRFNRNYCSSIPKAHLVVAGPIADEPGLRARLTRIPGELDRREHSCNHYTIKRGNQDESRCKNQEKLD